MTSNPKPVGWLGVIRTITESPLKHVRANSASSTAERGNETSDPRDVRDDTIGSSTEGTRNSRQRRNRRDASGPTSADEQPHTGTETCFHSPTNRPVERLRQSAPRVIGSARGYREFCASRASNVNKIVCRIAFYAKTNRRR